MITMLDFICWNYDAYSIYLFVESTPDTFADDLRWATRNILISTGFVIRQFSAGYLL